MAGRRILPATTATAIRITTTTLSTTKRPTASPVWRRPRRNSWARCPVPPTRSTKARRRASCTAERCGSSPWTWVTAADRSRPGPPATAARTGPSRTCSRTAPIRSRAATCGPRSTTARYSWPSTGAATSMSRPMTGPRGAGCTRWQTTRACRDSSSTAATCTCCTRVGGCRRTTFTSTARGRPGHSLRRSPARPMTTATRY